MISLSVVPSFDIRKVLQMSPSSLLLFLGLFFSTATKLRLPQLPLGLSDVFFLLFAVTAYTKGELNWRSKKHFSLLFLFFFCLLLANLGAYLSFYQQSSLYSFVYDNLSFLYVMWLTFLFLAYKGSLEEVLKFLIITELFISFVFCFFGLGNFIYCRTPRFSFLSVNPNQFALFLVPLPFFILHFITKSYESEINFNRIHWIILFCLAIVLSILTRSFSLLLSWVIVFAFIGIFYMRKSCHLSVFYSLICAFFVGLFGFCYWLFSAIEIGNFYGYSIHYYIYQIPSEFYIRLEIWENLLAMLENGKWILGYGPGALVQVRDIHHLPPQEAHNLFLGIIYQGGIISLFIALYGLYRLAIKTITTNQMFLCFALISLVFLSLLHNPIRMPILWFYLIYIYKICWRGEEYIISKQSLWLKLKPYKKSI